MATPPLSPPHSESEPHDQPSQTLTLENSEHSNLPAETQNQQYEDNPNVFNQDNQYPDHKFVDTIHSPSLSLFPQTLNLENAQHSDPANETRNRQEEGGPAVLDEDSQDASRQFGNPILSPSAAQSPKTPTLESTQHPDHPTDSENQKNEGDPAVLAEYNEDPDGQFGNPNVSFFTSPTPAPARARRLNKRKRGGFNKKKQQAIERKCQTLIKTLNPICFVPSKMLDFDRHEKLLKRLELWEFVHIEFDKSIRSDLLVQLIVNYDPKLRSSYVNEYRINLNRPALGRALKLPVRKEKSGSGAHETVALDVEEYGEEDQGFIEDFLSNWVLLHGDMWMMPDEVMSWTTEIKSGHPEKVDWAGLVWFMVEKELSRGMKLDDCYYASHLQYLIKSQREDVFHEEEPEVEVRKESVSVDEAVEADGESVVVEEPNVELTLGQEDVEKEDIKDDGTMDVDESKEGNMMVIDECEDDVVQGHWILDGKNSTGAHFLQHCNMKDDTAIDASEKSKLEEDGERTYIGGEEEMRSEDEDEGTFIRGQADEMKLEEEVEGHDEQEVEGHNEEEVEEDDEEEDDGEFSLMPKIHGMGNEGFAGNLQGIDVNNISYGVSGQFDDQSNMDIISPREEPYSSLGGPSFFGTTLKREMGYDHNPMHDPLSRGNKRPRTDGSSSKSSEFGLCMDQIQLWVGKARVMYEEKEHEVEELSQNQQILIGEVQQRDNVIEQLQKIKYEELQKRDVEINRLDRELFVMGNLIHGYRDALKATRKDFSEYRERCQLTEEPIYKDVGPGGLMLSTMEIERQRLKKEEEDRVNRVILEQNMKQFEEECVAKFEGYFVRVQMMDKKLLDLEKEVSLMKENSAKSTVSAPVDSAPIE